MATEDIIKESETQSGSPVAESAFVSADPVPEPDPVLVAPAFGASLQNAVAAFVDSLASLKSSDLGVDTARDAKMAAQTQLNKIQATEGAALGSRAESYESAGAARDVLVAVLQSWN